MPNPLVPQGTLNRIIASLAVINNPDLNIASFNLGDDGITLAFEGEASVLIGTLTGGVISPAPYQMCSIRAAILRTQPLVTAYKAQIETNTALGDIVITPDAITLENYYLRNCTLRTVAELAFVGRQPEFTITIQGIYSTNSDLFA
jgi:hypothetical protein